VSAKRVRAQLPRLPGPEFFADPRHSIAAEGGDSILSYDPETQAGFIYSRRAGTWQITAPVAFETWVVLARLLGLTIGDSEDARRWFRACCPRPEGDNVVDFIPPADTRH
jgi:hypothetical protein